MRTTTFLTTAVLAAGALARTDLEGCVSSATVAYGGASLIWYVPGTGEICSFLDCGGGRAPPKTTVPGCGAYSGTATYSPDYLPGYGPNATPTSTAAASSTAAPSPSVTAAPSLSSAAVSSSVAAASSSSEESAAASSAASSASSGISWTIMTSVATPVHTPSGTPAASTPATFTGAAGRIEAAAGALVGGVVAALAWL
ncbi:hypothetical protein SLS56_005218 [Neofusicoccum ribis]|uniref:Cell wall protein n=1 Tax=Neofusicoccum ribis TaxID=45134 RepID=A0ABR3SU76_9PEZI